jgi:YbgC/YbaW family acyl-CoA thioester hydrolase
MASEYRMVHRVEFSHTDMAGIMHFSNFFRFMEATEHAFFRSLGLSIMMEEHGKTVGWPRVHASCDYKKPLRFEEEVEVVLRVREKGERSLTYDFHFFKVGTNPPLEVATGRLAVAFVAVDREAGTLKSVPIPPEIAAKIEPAPSLHREAG